MREDEWAREGQPEPYVPDPRPFYYGNHPKRSFEEPPGLYIDQKTEVFAAFARAFDPDPEPLIAYYRACHDTDKPDDNIEAECSPTPGLVERILRGRELAGEARDFSY